MLNLKLVHGCILLFLEVSLWSSGHLGVQGVVLQDLGLLVVLELLQVNVLPLAWIVVQTTEFHSTNLFALFGCFDICSIWARKTAN